MPIRKDAATGSHFISYLVPRRPSDRARYQPTPLAVRKPSFLDFLKGIFGGRTNPFLASPVAHCIDKEIKLEKDVRRESRTGGDRALALFRNKMEPELRRYLHTAHGRADKVLDALDIETNEEETKLEECRPNAIREGLKGDLDEVLVDVEGYLGPPARRLHVATGERDQFMIDYGLDSSRRVHSGHRVDAKFLISLLLVTLFEFVLNTMFFSGSQRNGLIGGAALAMILSISTIFLGVCFGWSFQFADARADGNGWRGRAGIIVLSFATAFYLLLLTLARRAGDSGDLDMFGTAARQIQERPFAGILDLPALGYCFFSIGVITLVAWKFADTMGHFPRIRNHKLAVENAEREFEGVRVGMAEDLEAKIDAAVAKLDDVPSLVQARKLALKEILVDYENVVEQFYADVTEITDAQDLMVDFVRSYSDAGDDLAAPDVSYDGEVAYFRQRLSDFRQRIEALLKRADISEGVIDRCRTEMTNLGKRRRKELEHECDRLRNVSTSAGPRAPTEPPPSADPSTDSRGNVSWLRARRA
jgi:hypothetical protein